MKKQTMFALLTAAVILVSMGLTGCSSGKVAGLSGPGLTKEQVNQRHYEAVQTDLWQLQDDIDAFFLIDRPGRMHRMVVR
jgi:predicted small secreted protein